jgi:hypothetical protein
LERLKITELGEWMQRIRFERAEGMSSFGLSKLVASLKESSFRPFVHKHGGVSWMAKKAILRVLADHYPNIWPSVATIASEAGLHDRQTQKGLSDLEKDGYIRAVSNKKGGSDNSVQYELNAGQIRVQVEIDELKKSFEAGLTAALEHIKQNYPLSEWDDEATGWIIDWNRQHECMAWEWPHRLEELPISITGWHSDFLAGKSKPALAT